MNTERILNRGKPYILGGILGVIAAVIIGFSAGWVVTSDTMAEEVYSARTNAYATVCATNSMESWKEQGNEMDALGGYSNEERDALIKQNMPVLPNTNSNLSESIQDNCEDKIRSQV
ncbi:hypothetical protein ACFOW6_01060 [Fodinicurvata halophila]|uniref:Uncharacterized protein n=1 Tax=Fodinicurvata halophila TaxID=1419723 RepID=A0ABV8UFR6_9PROT